MACCVVGCTNHQAINKDLSFHVFPHPEREVQRHKQWVENINNPKFSKLEPLEIYRRMRVCRHHFESWCLNGACKRLLNTAIPTLYLNGDRTQKIYQNSLLKKRKSEEPTITKRIVKLTRYHCDQQALQSENIDNEIDDVVYYAHHTNVDEEVVQQIEEYIPAEEQDYELVDIVDEVQELEDLKFSAPLSEDFVQKCRTDFYECPKNRLAQNVCTRIDPFEACLSRKTLENTQHVFTYKVENEGKPLTNQKSSGRCWIFATLNCIRLPFIKQYNLDEFEFSQGYLFYWDKIERSNYFLNNIVDTARRGEEVDGRLVAFLLSDPTCDGGQWDMVVNLINKHGLMPKKCFPESYSCEASARMNSILKSKLREYGKVLRDMIAEQASDEDVQSKIAEQMKEIYNVVGICLGIPPEKFTWEYYDKSKKYLCIGPIKPVDFYEKYVKPYFNVDDKVCLVTDPRPSNPYGRAYTVDCLGNVVGGRPVLYNNQPVELLMELVTKGLKFGEPIWFGCEVSKRFAGKQGIEDLDVHDFKLVFGVDIQTTLTKADRLLYGESMMTHAMTFTGVSVDQDGKSTKFRVENSWGEDRGEKGYLIMTAEWFKEFVFEVVVDRSIVPPDVLSVFDMPPILLPAWDPMGTLAK